MINPMKKFKRLCGVFALMLLALFVLVACNGEPDEAPDRLSENEAILLDAIETANQVDAQIEDENWWALQAEIDQAEVALANVDAQMERYLRTLEADEIEDFAFSEAQLAQWESEVEASLVALHDAYETFVENEGHWEEAALEVGAVDETPFDLDSVDFGAADGQLVASFAAQLEIAPFNAVVVTNVDELRAAVLAAPTDGSLTEIHLDFSATGDRAYNDDLAIEIADGRNIWLRSAPNTTQMQSVVQRYGIRADSPNEHVRARHFVVRGPESQLTLGDVALNGNSAHDPILTGPASNVDAIRGGVLVLESATLVLDGGIVEENRSPGTVATAGAIRVEEGTLRIESGVIRNT